MSAFDLDQPVPFVGQTPSKILLIGEGPGETEHRTGRPFSGPTGEELKMYLGKAGLSLRYLRYGNAVQYWTGPGNPDPDEDDLLRDRQVLLDEIEACKPEIIVTVGRIATNIFIPDVSMEEVHGIAHHVDIGPLFDWDGPWTVIVIPCYHPAFGLHQPQVAGAIYRDFQVVGKVAKDGEYAEVEWAKEDEYPDPDYQLAGIFGGKTLEMPKGFQPYVGMPMAVDTEGWEDDPWCLTYSVQPGWGRLIRAHSERWIELFNAFLRKWRPTLIFHWEQHDVPVLEAMGVYVGDLVESAHDTMFEAYNLNEPQGLKALCRRHSGMVMQDYEDLTRPYDNAQAIQWLEAALDSEDVLALPKPDPIMEEDSKTGKMKVRKPVHVKNRIATCLRPAQPGKKKAHPRAAWLAVEPEIRGPVEAIQGAMPRFTLDLVPFEDVLPYACRDADGTLREHLYMHPRIQAQAHTAESYEIDRCSIPGMIEMTKVGMPVNPERFRLLDHKLELGIQKVLNTIKEMNGGEYVNPNSPAQVRHVLFEKLALPIKKLTKGGKSGVRQASTNDKVLEALQNMHPIAKQFTYYRAKAKLRDSFTEVLPEIAGADGRIHTVIKGTRTITGRRAAERMQAIPVREEEGREVRSGFEEDEGYFIASCDLSQIEFRVFAHLSEDPLLIKRMQAGYDVHTATACDIFGVSESEAKKDKHTYRDPAKRVGFGIITGITGRGLHEQFELNGIFHFSEEDCDQMIADWFRVYKGGWGYIQGIREYARRRGFVRTMWGRQRDLPQVYSHIPWVRGEGERGSHSHQIQGSAAEVLKRAEWRLYKEKQQARYRHIKMLLTIHDEIVVRGRRGDGREEETGALMQWAMTADQDRFRVPILAEYAYGQDWGELK